MERDKERLKQVLASYGAGRSRWPESDRKLLDSGDPAGEAAAIDALLDRASSPPIPVGGQSRLLARAAELSRPDNVVVLRKRQHRQFWISVTALAASLALGLFVGTQDDFADVLPFGLSASADDAMALTGLGEAEETLEGDAS
jgi:hypothetical protein